MCCSVFLGWFYAAATLLKKEVQQQQKRKEVVGIVSIRATQDNVICKGYLHLTLPLLTSSEQFSARQPV